jgi:L-alanine-DL-glutamate epimerase-like enolase superfamily enzyme
MAKINLATYAIPVAELGLGYFPSGHRHGLLVRLEDDDGEFGIGEYAPIASVHAVGIEHLCASLPRILKDSIIQNLLTKPPTSNLSDYFAAHFPYPQSFVLSMAHWHYWLKKNAFHLGNAEYINLSSLITESDNNDTINTAYSRVDEGYTTLKIKISNTTLQGAIKKITQLQKSLSPPTRFRLDANRFWSSPEVSNLCDFVDKERLDYFEEPTPHVLEWPTIAAKKIAFAIDESYANEQGRVWHAQLGVKNWIIKPARFNNIYWLNQAVTKAMSADVHPIFSPCFESDFFAALFSVFIAQAGCSHLTHGIYEPKFLKTHVLSQCLSHESGRVSVEHCRQLIHAFDLADQQLQPFIKMRI